MAGGFFKNLVAKFGPNLSQKIGPVSYTPAKRPPAPPGNKIQSSVPMLDKNKWQKVG